MKHFVVVCGLAWGHLRPLQALSIRLCQINRDLHITLVLPKFLNSKAALDRRRYGFEQVQDRFHIVLSGDEREEGKFLSSEEMIGILGKVGEDTVGFYNGLKEGKVHHDELTNTDVAPWSTHPEAVLLDIVVFQVGMALRQMYQGVPSMPRLFSILPIANQCISFYYGPVFNQLVADVRSSEDRKAGYQKYVVDSGIRNELPGHHPFYHHELDPNKGMPEMFDIFFAFNAFKDTYDANINFWPTVFNRELGSASAAGEPNRDYIVGPQLSSDNPTSGANEIGASGHDGKILAFLNKWQKSSGDHSVLYISFGSLEYPPLGNHLWHLIDVLDELKVPYLLARGNAPPQIAEKLPDRIKQSQGRGLLATWVPQVTVLSHSAIMGFVSHGGSNSAMEALLCGVPLIHWPSTWDQPLISNQMDFIGVAIELLQVRGEHNIGKDTARGIKVIGTPEAIKDEMRQAIQRLQGVSGDAMRQRVREWGRKLEKDISEGGEAYANLKKLAFVEATKAQ